MKSNARLERKFLPALLAGCFIQDAGMIRSGGSVGPKAMPVKSITQAPYRIAADVTITEEAYAGRLGYFEVAAGAIVTLPRATGSGAKYEFFCKTTITSNGMVIKVANADDVMQGIAYVAQDGGDTIVAFEAGSTADTFTGNGSTTGGIRGDRVALQDVAPGLFSVTAWLSATGTEASPFSAAVS